MSFLATPYLLLRRVGVIRDNDPVSFVAGMWWTGYCLAAIIILLALPSWKSVGFLIAVAALGAVWHVCNRFLYSHPRRHEPPRTVTHADGRQAEIIEGRYRHLPETPTKPPLLDRIDKALGLED